MDKSTFRRVARWVFYCVHAPLSAFWLIIAVVAVGGTVAVILGRISFWEATSSVLTLAAVTALLARVKGVPAWPPPLATNVERESVDREPT